MNKKRTRLSRRDFLAKTTLAGAGLAGLNKLGGSHLLDGLAPFQLGAGDDSLYSGFVSPPKEYDLIPLWT
jgi:hypothetical protein